MKIVGLTSVSGPYIHARWSRFSLQRSDVDVYLIEFGCTSTTYPWSFSEKEYPYSRVILSEKASELESPLNLSYLLIQSLNDIQPDVVVLNGYSEIPTLSALIWCKLKQRLAILMSASKEDDCPRSPISEFFKSLLVKSFQSALVGGYPQKRYLLKLGKSSESIFTGYNVVENSTFSPEKISSFSSPLSKPYFLSVNRFVSKKNLPFLIKSYFEYREKLGSISYDLVLSGDGPLRLKLERQVQVLKLEKYVHFTGFLQQDQLLPYFAHASCFVHTSTQEQWGLVINEAMAAGLPVLLSNRCGCYEDLLLEGINGFGFDPENQQQLTDLMIKVSTNQVDLEAMRHATLKHIQGFSPDYFAQGLTKAIDYALTCR